MRFLLTLFILSAAAAVCALDYADIDYCAEMSDPGPPFAEPQTVLRAIASGDNYFAHVNQGSVDFHIQNPGLDTINLFLVVVSPQGGQFTKFVKVDAGQTRTVAKQVLDGSSEFYLISMQNFRLDLEADGQTKRMTVNNPFKPSLDFVRVRTAENVIVTVGVDSHDKVHYIAHGNEIGALDRVNNLVRLHNRTELPLATRSF